MKRHTILNYSGETGNFVYKLSFSSSTKIYIGVTNNPERRISQHINSMNHKNTKGKRCANWIGKHIEDNILVMEILSILPEYKSALEREVEIIKLYKEAGFNLINITNGGVGSPGKAVSQETRDKISNSLLGKRHTEDRRNNQSIARLAHTPEYKLVNPEGEIILIKNLKKFSTENNLDYSTIHRVAVGKVKQHKGYTKA